MMTRGWAYVNADGEIDIRTVSPTMIAAMVNAIVLLSEQRCIPTADQPDWMIQNSFSAINCAQLRRGHIRPVRITAEDS